jgi:sugar phosphate isomerase/epimerase
MKKSVILTGFSDEISPDLNRQLAVVKTMGMDHIEVRGVNGCCITDYTPQEAVSIRKQLDSHGIRVSSVGSPIGKIKITDDFAPHFRQFQNSVELAGILGTRYIRIFSFYMPEAEAPSLYRTEVLLRLEKMLDYAVRKDIILLHENEKDIYGDVPKRCVDLFQNLSSPNLRGIFDFANFVQCGQDTTEAYEQLRPYIDYIHIKDARSKDKTVVPAGMGDGRLKELLLKFKLTGYTGFLSLEPHLQNFIGFHSLEETADTGEEIEDGTAAFTTAAQALKAMLWDLNWY